MPAAKELGVDVLDIVVNTFKIEGEERGEEYYFACVNPGHADHRPSCSVNLETGFFFCFSCGAGGDLLALGALALGLTRHQVEGLITASPTQPGYVEKLWNKLNARLKKETKQALLAEDLPGPYEPEPLHYLRERGFTDPTLSLWGCRYVPEERLQGNVGQYVIRDYVAVPVFNASQVQVGWVYRATKDQKLRYTVTPGMKRNEVWFGCHLFANSDEVVITEGELDAMWVSQCGYPALAMMGSRPSEQKINWLKRYQQVTIFADHDAAGVAAVLRIGEQLRYRVDLKVARYHRVAKGKDPQDLHPVDVELSVYRAQPYILWKRNLEADRVG